jgi:hypothetical protein
VGELAASRDFFGRVASTDDMYVQYYTAIAAADRGELETARAAAAAAVRLGYPAAILAMDPSLERLGLVVPGEHLLTSDTNDREEK